MSVGQEQALASLKYINILLFLEADIFFRGFPKFPDMSG